MPSTTELTQEYISEHRSIKDCLKRGIINYSALSRLIAKELGIEKKASREAILIAARRYKDKIKGPVLEDSIAKLIKNINIDIKNNIVICTLDKRVHTDSLIDVEKTIKEEKDLFFSIEGTKTITIIIQEKNAKLMTQKFKKHIVKKEENLSLITISHLPNVEETPGVLHHLFGLFFEHEINIEEFMSCHHDTLIVVQSKNINKLIEFLKF
tara:strand:+ start:1679 stop:2311 length:633 start_codon:yes stop_codon:yes gene_type:complete